MYTQTITSTQIEAKNEFEKTLWVDTHSYRVEISNKNMHFEFYIDDYLLEDVILREMHLDDDFDFIVLYDEDGSTFKKLSKDIFFDRKDEIEKFYFASPEFQNHLKNAICQLA